MAAQQTYKLRLIAPGGVSVSFPLARTAVLGFVGLVAGLLAIGGGGLLERLYPAAALAVGVVLYLRCPGVYLSYTWWLWFLSPEVRRLVDYQSGWNPVSPVMIAPYLVTGLAAITLLRYLPRFRLYAVPFSLVLLGLSYAYTVGVVRAGFYAATFDLLTWAVPVVFGFHLAATWRRYAEQSGAVCQTFALGTLVMGAYGIVQFYLVPPWDAYWMVSAEMYSIGRPEPFEVRVFSTMNAPGPFAAVMMAGLLVTLIGKGPLRWIAAAPGYASFFLSLVRSAWLGWLTGVVLLLVQGWARQKVGMLAGVLAVGMLVLPLWYLEPIAETVMPRITTLSDVENDNSFGSRLAFYRDFLFTSLSNVPGAGLGATGLATKLTAPGGAFGRTFDSGLMQVPFVLGWPGAALYVAGVCWIAAMALRPAGNRYDDVVPVARAISVALLIQMASNNTLIGVTGTVFWTFTGLALAARRCHQEHQEIT